MYLVWAIVWHSFKLVFSNLPDALRISIVPAVLLAALFGLFLLLSGVSGQQFAEGLDPGGLSASPPNPLRVGLGSMVNFFGSLFVYAWLAVAWHRFILLEEYPKGFVPHFRWPAIKAYIWTGIVLGLLTLAGVFLVFVPLLVSFGTIGEDWGSWFTSVVGMIAVAFYCFLIYCLFRISIKLPAAAIGEWLSVSQAWEVTKPYAWTILGSGTLFILVSLILQFGMVLLAPIPIVGVVAAIASSWISALLTLSVLTTLYGVVVEGRDLG